MHQAIVLDRQSGKQYEYPTEKVRNRFGLQIAALDQAENYFGFFTLETINLSVSVSVNH
jgi:hypothetical protein